MSVVEDIKSITPFHYFNVILVFATIVAPGFLLLYLFKSSLLHELDVFKLLVFSTSLLIPMVAFNFFCLYFLTRKKDQPSPKIILIGTLIITGLAIYPALLSVYFTHMGFKTFLYVLCVLNILSIGFGLKSFLKV